MNIREVKKRHCIATCFMPGGKSTVMYDDPDIECLMKEVEGLEAEVVRLGIVERSLRSNLLKAEAERDGYKAQIEAVDNILKTYGIDGPLSHDRVFKLIQQFEADKDKLVKALEKIFEMLKQHPEAIRKANWKYKVHEIVIQALKEVE